MRILSTLLPPWRAVATAIAGLVVGGILAVAPVLTLAAAGINERIVGGRATTIDEWPWQVALMSRDGQFCGGSIIAPSWVLTAAHCIYDGLKVEDLSVLEGTTDLSRGGRRLRVGEIIVHPGWDSMTTTNDIALLRLLDPAGSPAIRWAVATADAATEAPRTRVTVTGWGRLRPVEFRGGRRVDSLTGRPVSDAEFAESYRIDRLMKVTLPVVDHETCAAAYPGRIIDQRNICAGVAEGGMDSCQGDSGGPLVTLTKAGWIQVGLVSWGGICGKAGSYGVYTRLSRFDDWIRRVTGLVPKISEYSANSGAPAVPAVKAGSQIGVLGVLADGRSTSEATTRFAPGQSVVFRVQTDAPGYLTIIDRRPDGTVNRLFPNRYTPPRLKDQPIAAGMPHAIPLLSDPYDRVRFAMPNSSGDGMIFAIFSSAPLVADPNDLSSALASAHSDPERLAEQLAAGIGARTTNGKAGIWASKIDYVITR